MDGHEISEVIEAFHEHRQSLLPSYEPEEGIALLCAIFGVNE